MEQAKIIVIDPGHGGQDDGAVNRINGVYEDTTTLILGKLVVAKLALYKAEVILTRTTDDEVTLEQRVNIANNAGADYFLSLHVNSSVNKEASGYESYVYRNASTRSRTIRDIIHDAVYLEFLQKYGIVDRGKKEAGFYVTRYTNCPASLHEFLFISNDRESSLLTDHLFLNGLANELAWGLAQALDLKRRYN